MPDTTLPSVLTRIRSDRATPRSAEARCEMCAETITDPHQHVVDVESRQLMCVCRGCYLLFTDAAARLRYRAVPDRYLAWAGPAMSRRQWDALQIPVGLAFFFYNSTLGRVVAFYPGPAGATESELDLQVWNDIRDTDPRVDDLAADTEALLVRNMDEDVGPRVYLLPVDACYEFVGRLRLLWHGFDGGQQARAYIDEFFGLLDDRSTVVQHE